jgi:hypothetical protein
LNIQFLAATIELKSKIYFFASILIGIVMSCSRVTPAGFWTNFHYDLINKKDSDQGPWGGYREIHWKSKERKTFTSEEVIDFAKQNDWQITDSLNYTNNILEPLTNYNKTDYSADILENTFLKKINSPHNNVFVFKTGWVAVEPGNAKETEKNGFVTINSDGTELIIYHSWGE